MAMKMTRRTLLVGAAAASLAPQIGFSQPQDVVVPRPNPKSFQNGDLVWPKKPGAYVPYASVPDADYDADKRQWLADRDAYVGRMEKDPTLDEEGRKELDRLRTMEFSEFVVRYEADEQVGVYTPYAGSGLYVGHVGFIEIDKDSTAWVIEAVLHKGVIRQRYSEWLAGRPGTYVWHGRIRDVNAAQSDQMIAESKKHIGKPYDFWNFDLDSDKGFYCSKLIWLSAHRALDIAVDGKSKAKRWFWFSPKQLLYAKRVHILHNPGKYGSV